MLDGLALQADVALQPLADALGFPIDTIKFIICIFLGYPLGILIRYCLLPPRPCLALLRPLRGAVPSWPPELRFHV